MDGDGGDTAALSPRERAHLRHRDRKRVTTMVMDNAGVRRLAGALGRRRAAGRRDETGQGGPTLRS